MSKTALKRALFGVVIAATLTSTASASAVTDFDPSTESIFVMRVKTNLGHDWRGRIIIYNGKLADTAGFKFSLFTPARYSDFPQGGFIVGRAKRGEWLGLANIGENMSCKDGNTLAFRVDPGKVGYVGEVTATPKGVGFTVTSHQDEAAAQAFIEQYYPQWKGQLDHAEARVVTVDKKCALPSQTIYIHM